MFVGSCVNVCQRYAGCENMCVVSTQWSVKVSLTPCIRGSGNDVMNRAHAHADEHIYTLRIGRCVRVRVYMRMFLSLCVHTPTPATP